MEKYYSMPLQKVLENVESSEKGLSNEQAQNRLHKYGKNALLESKRKSTFVVFLEQFKDFLVIILIVAGILSLFLSDAESAIVIFVVITINAILGTIQHIKAEQSLESLKALSAPSVKVLRDGQKITVPSQEITVGDVVFLEAGDFVSADGRILENFSMKVNESSLTGESVSVEKEITELPENAAIGDRKNMLFSGSFLTYGRGSYVVTNIGMDTEIGKIAQLLKNTEQNKTPLQKNLDSFGKRLSIIIIIVCAILFFVNIAKGGEIIDAFLFAVALAVAAIPEALSSIVTIVLSLGTQKMAKENAIVRKLPAVEGLGSVSVICSDKTGTLTQNKMTVQKYCVNNTMTDGENIDITKYMDKKLLIMSVLCNDAVISNGQELGDPTEVALIQFAQKHTVNDENIKQKYKRLLEIPFDSDRKLMSTVHNIDGKYIMITKGAVDVLLDRVVSIEQNGEILPFTQQQKQKVIYANKTFSENGLRVLAFAYKELQQLQLEKEQNYTFVGLIAMIDPPREESKKAVEECMKAGIRPVMITGDHKVTASAIAKQIGILTENKKAVDGTEIDNMTDKQLEDFVEQVSVYARVSPEHKIRIVKAWQKKGNIVAMTGDGVNDAPALKQSDIGVAMGITGSEVAKDASAMVLTDDNFATIVKAVENGRNLYQNIKNAIQFLLSGNTAGILAVLYASFMGLAVPFAPVHLLFINLLTDSLPAIALGVEPHTNKVMNEKPRSIHTPIMTKDFLIDVVLQGAIIAVFTMTSYYIGMEQGSRGLASTMAFATLCLCRLFHGFSCKSKEMVLFTKRMFDNWYLWGAFLIGFVLLNIAILFPPFRAFFVVVPINGMMLFTIYGLSFASLLVIQLLKMIKTKL
ncbi:cation-translocating P-type ATPase [Lachnospiraceae bacterium 46-61]